MPHRRMTLSKFIIEEQRRADDPRPDLTSLLNDIQTACKLIAVAASRGPLNLASHRVRGGDPADAQQKTLDALANEIMVSTCEWGGQLAGMVSKQMDSFHLIPAHYPHGRNLLVFDPLDGSSNIDVNAPLGTIFSVLRCPDGVTAPTLEDFLQPGTRQIAAGYAIYGPIVMMVITLGGAVHGFTLDPEIGAFTLTHPAMTIPAATSELAVNISNERFWEPPVRRYVEECIDGAAGERGRDFNMRWIASTVAELHRILIRGGLFMVPREGTDPDRSGRLRLLYEANPIAMIVEQAGGAASTGRQRLLDMVPKDIHQVVPMILGSRDEVERLERYHAEWARGEELTFKTPLFQTRSLFRTA